MGKSKEEMIRAAFRVAVENSVTNSVDKDIAETIILNEMRRFLAARDVEATSAEIKEYIEKKFAQREEVLSDLTVGLDQWRF